MRMTCTDKFGTPVPMPAKTEACDFSADIKYPKQQISKTDITQCFESGKAAAVFEYIRDNIPDWSFDDIRTACDAIVELAERSEKHGNSHRGADPAQ